MFKEYIKGPPKSLNKDDLVSAEVLPNRKTARVHLKNGDSFDMDLEDYHKWVITL